MSRTLEILIALTCGIIIGKFLLIPLLEIWSNWRYEKNVASIKSFVKEQQAERMNRVTQDAYKDELEKLQKEDL